MRRLTRCVAHSNKKMCRLSYVSRDKVKWMLPSQQIAKKKMVWTWLWTNAISCNQTQMMDSTSGEGRWGTHLCMHFVYSRGSPWDGSSSLVMRSRRGAAFKVKCWCISGNPRMIALSALDHKMLNKAHWTKRIRQIKNERIVGNILNYFCAQKNEKNICCIRRLST